MGIDTDTSTMGIFLNLTSALALAAVTGLLTTEAAIATPRSALLTPESQDCWTASARPFSFELGQANASRAWNARAKGYRPPNNGHPSGTQGSGSR